MPYVQICPVCNAMMESMGEWPLYPLPNNITRLYRSTFVCNNCDKLHNPPSVITKTVWLYPRPKAV